MHRFSSAHVISAIALFVALTGTAIAVEKDSIGTKQLKDHAVKESKLGDHAVTEAKLADDAVTGAKVKESTLGQVPSAASADSAAKANTATNATRATSATRADTATSATTATNATNATTATNATNATTADSATSATTAGSATTATSAGTATTALNAALLAGHDLQSVRPFATGVASSQNQDLDPVAYVNVLTVPVDIPAAGADLIVNASFTVRNAAAAARQTQCSFIDNGAAPGEGTTMILPVGISANGSLTALVNDVAATSPGNPQDVTLRCQGAGVNGDVVFDGGSLDVLRVPIG